VGAIAGVVVVTANVAAVVAVSVGGVSSAYRIDEFERWVAQVHANPGTSDLAAVLFMIGCAAFVPFGFAVGALVDSAWSRTTIVIAGLLNVIGPVFTMVYARAGGSESLLNRAIEFDAAFNALLGVGLIILGARAIQARRALGVASIIVGVITLPVALQFFSGAAAKWLAIAGPAWLVLVLAWSWALWRSR
jgi:hypothetical protein